MGDPNQNVQQNQGKSQHSANIQPTNQIIPSTAPRKVAQPLDTSKFDLTDGLPTEDVINEKTLEAEPNPLEVGEYTAELSDVSDADGDQEKRTASRNALSTWYRRIQPLIRNKRVRAFAIINSLLTAINLFLFLACIIVLGFLLFEIVSVAHRTSEDKPCIYQWTEWGSCSATCATFTKNGKNNYTNIKTPTKTRTVIKQSIIQTRGRKYEKCPSDLETRVDYAPCNTHLCPQKLSQFEFSKDINYDDPTKIAGSCYRIREIPQMDMLIEIDVSDLTKDAKCPNI